MNTISSTYPIQGCVDSRIGGRSENQDFWGYADTPSGFLLVVCDGMGGGPGGRTASSTVVNSVIQFIKEHAEVKDRKELLTSAIKAADANIAEIIQQNPSLEGMGTTIVCLFLNKDSAVIAQVGDSRLYQMRLGQLVFRTQDHSLVAECVRKGELTEEEARLSSNSNILTKAVNGRGMATPSLYEVAYEKGDYFFLCTDGIWNTLSEKDLIKALHETRDISATTLKIANDIDELGKMSGGHHDNLTLALLETLSDSEKSVPMSEEILKGPKELSFKNIWKRLKELSRSLFPLRKEE